MAAGRCKSAATSIGLRPRVHEQLPELAAGGRFAGTLQAAQHQHRHVAAEMERVVHRPHQTDQLLMDDVDELLGGIERLEDRFAHGLVVHPVHEVLHDRQADVGFEQGPLDQLQAVAHVRLGEPSAPAQGPQRRTQVFRERFKHSAGQYRGIQHFSGPDATLTMRS